MTKERLFKKAYARELLAVARGDLETAKALVKARISRRENILFHAQQAIEKALKAYLCWGEIPVPMVHDLSIICDRFPEGVVIPHADALFDLGQFATIKRYEESSFVLTDEEIQAAEQAAADILRFVEDFVGS